MDMKASSDKIPQYSLYGEDEATFDLCHIELISTRSGRNDWKISPHKHHDYVQVIFVKSGQVVVSLDGRDLTLKSPVALTVPVGVVHGFRFSPDTMGCVFTVSDRMSADSSLKIQRVYNALFSQPLSVQLGDESVLLERLNVLSEWMLENHNHRLEHTSATEQWLLLSNVLCIINDIWRVHGQRSEHTSSGQTKWRHFQALVGKYYAEQWPVERYAETLGVSERTLNRICRDHSGKTAFGIIQGRLQLEAERRLAYTQASASDIAHMLGFSDLGYFSRFFKKQSGKSPSQFRAQSRKWD